MLIEQFYYIFAFLAVCLLAWIYLWYKRPKNFPRGPRGLPFVGGLSFLGKYPERTITKWSEKYGDVMAVRMGPKNMVVLQ